MVGVKVLLVALALSYLNTSLPSSLPLIATLNRAQLLISCALSDVFQSIRAANGTLDNFLSTETPIALQGILNNIGGSGLKAAGVEAGLVVASPSKSNPDCEYPFLTACRRTHNPHLQSLCFVEDESHVVKQQVVKITPCTGLSRAAKARHLSQKSLRLTQEMSRFLLLD